MFTIKIVKNRDSQIESYHITSEYYCIFAGCDTLILNKKEFNSETHSCLFTSMLILILCLSFQFLYVWLFIIVLAILGIRLLYDIHNLWWVVLTGLNINKQRARISKMSPKERDEALRKLDLELALWKNLKNNYSKKEDRHE